MTELHCRHPYSQWGASLALVMFPLFVSVWRDESPDLLDACYQARQLIREILERVSGLDLSLSTTGHREEYNNSARAVILYLRFIAVPP